MIMRIIDPNDPHADLPANPPVRTAQVLRLHGVTKHDIDPALVLGADVLWLLERLKLRLLTVGDERHT